MPELPESLAPKSARAERDETEYRTISYRSVVILVVLVVAGVGVGISVFLYPEQIKRAIAKLLESTGGTAVAPALEQRQARFVNIDGTVRVKKANGVHWVAASPNLALEKGDVVQTSSDGQARIAFADGTIYMVRADTLLVVEENSGVPNSKVTNVSVQVTTGEVDLSTTKFEGESKVVFANAVARIAQDTRASVRNDPKSQTSQFTMTQGHAEVLRGSEKVELGSYEQVSFQADSSAMERRRVVGPPMLLTPVNQAPVIAAETGRTEVTFVWSPVPTAKNYRLRLSTSPIFSTLVYDKKVPSSTAKVPALTEGVYYWAVSSIGENGKESQTSDASKFSLLRQKDEILLEVQNVIQHGKTIEIVGRTEPGARIMVNDQPVFAVQPDGSFKHFTPPFTTNGANIITVTAQNAKGQIATRRKTVYIQ
ncbi:MAG: FecR domain-containing protein [Acidobacteria bacterium]|jgi:hypothetical protein|nr:FecR domain-containing protein [Acidobacteriota bacterium]